ncbi:MAG: alpha/beta fold hydrolase [Syntrophaceae bacterium]|nr:alpha/beta fold hydrolase [Syntrophaceae bacterium]
MTNPISTRAIPQRTFSPVFPLRNPHLQTILASLRVRARGDNPLRTHSEETLVDAGGGVRLLGFQTLQPRGRSRGLVILLHGWEGSSDSTYMLTTGRRFFLSGYDVFRLNLRDHGPSHHLNEGVFHSARIEEVLAAVLNVVANASDRPCHLIGFSLGGNFGLRIALRLAPGQAGNLRSIIAVSPVLDPLKATHAIDGGLFIYRDYFVRKWKRSLGIKQRLFPGLYDFGDVMGLKSCMAITERVIPRYTPFRDVLEYFRTYTLTGADFSRLPLDVTILASEDDPVIPVEDFRTLRGNDRLRVLVERYGGHCGFLQDLRLRVWFEDVLEDAVRRASGED